MSTLSPADFRVDYWQQTTLVAYTDACVLQPRYQLYSDGGTGVGGAAVWGPCTCWGRAEGAGCDGGMGVCVREQGVGGGGGERGDRRGSGGRARA